MNTFRSGATAAIIGLGLFVSAGQVSAQSLTDALVGAYQTSADLKSGRSALRSTDENVAIAWSAKRPTINLSGSTGYGHSFNAGIGSGTATTSRTASLTLSAELILWDAGATDLAVEVAHQNVLAARDTLVDTEQLVLLNAATAFLDMRRDAQFLQLAENNRRVISRQVQAAKDRFEVGEIRRTDVSQAEARLAAALSTIALRQGNLEISRESYYLATGAYPGALRAPPSPPKTPSTLAAAKSIALSGHPSVLRAKRMAKVAELNVYRAEAAMKPKVSLSANVTARNPASTTGDTASLTIGGSAPIYRGGSLTATHRQAKALEQQSRADIQLAGQRATQNVTRFWAQIQISRASITARQKEVRASRVALRGIREEANLGARTTLDVLDAERELVAAETDLVSARRDEHVAVYSLLSAMGLLTARHLQLGVKTYDVNSNYDKVKTAPGPTKRGKLLEKIFKRAGKK